MYCVTTSGYSLTTAILLSLMFGGFGADRFYLGHVATGFVKLLALGGFGIWSLIDVIFLCCGVLNPRDGTLFHERVQDYNT
jgi:TM2 domain-containing membrane protein YozV